MDRENPRTNGKSKAVQTKHTKKHIHTLTKREKGKKIYLYIKKKNRRNRATKSINKSTNDNKLNTKLR